MHYCTIQFNWINILKVVVRIKLTHKTTYYLVIYYWNPNCFVLKYQFYNRGGFDRVSDQKFREQSVINGSETTYLRNLRLCE